MTRPGAGMIHWSQGLEACVACNRPTMHPKGTPNARHPACLGAAVLPDVADPKKKQKGMNKGERRFVAEVLEAEKRSGVIRWFGEHEGVKLKLAPATHLSPDFPAIGADGELFFYEVKPRKGAGFYARPDAWLKLKMAAAHTPFRFVVVWPAKNGGWNRQIVPRE